MDGDWAMGILAAGTFMTMLGYLLWQARYH